MKNANMFLRVLLFSLVLTVGAIASVLSSCNDVPQEDSFPEEDDSLIYWNSEYRLKWSDFRRPLDGREKFEARTVSGVGYYCTYDQNEYIAVIRSFFMRDSSHTIVQEQSDALLAHEEAYFAVSEVAAREVRAKIAQWNGSGEFETYVKLCVDSSYTRTKIRHEQYDLETNHGVNVQEQKEWEKRIDSLLLANKEFEDAAVHVPFPAQRNRS